MESSTQKLIHTFGALADLGQEIADAGDFEDMLRNSFHLLLGSLAIRRGGVAEYVREAGQLKLVAVRGLGESPVDTLPLSPEHARHLATLGAAKSLAVASNEAARFLEDHKQFFATVEIDLLLVGKLRPLPYARKDLVHTYRHS